MRYYNTIVAPTYIVFSLEPKDGPGLVASDTLLDFEYIAVEIWTGAIEEMRKSTNFSCRSLMCTFHIMYNV